MGINAFVEPFVVITLLLGGTWMNRNKEYKFGFSNSSRRLHKPTDQESLPGSPVSFQSDDTLLRVSLDSPLSNPDVARLSVKTWRTRKIRLPGLRKTVWTPNTRIFEDRWFSRVIRKFPFLREVWYWALIYWVRSESPSASSHVLIFALLGVPARPSIHSCHSR